ncbi:MAG: helix-turn-helix domain-containing protein [Labedaea sp.]
MLRKNDPAEPGPMEPISSPADLAGAIHRILLRYERCTGRAIKRARLARTIGVSASSLYAYLNGTTVPSAGTLDRLLDALDASAAERRRLTTARDELIVAYRHGERRAGSDDLPVAYRQLPMDIAQFTGRANELNQLRILAETAADADTATVLAVIAGMPGVGKTRLAVRAAHQIVAAGYFGDIQLWADLRGYDPDRAPAEPADVLALFLRLLGVADEHVPTAIEARAALYRDRLHHRAALVVLDNAADENQVRPLLPGGPGCLVLVTSRRNLPGIDGAHPIRLDDLPEPEAIELLARHAGRARVAAEPAAAADIVARCGCLPSAITAAARLLQARPAWRLADLAARLAAGESRLAHLALGGRNVRAAFTRSYRALPPDLRRLFRLLGEHPVGDVTPWSAAALGVADTDQAERALDELVDHHLLQQAAPGHYRLHTLVRAYATDLARPEDPAGPRPAARH